MAGEIVSEDALPDPSSKNIPFSFLVITEIHCFFDSHRYKNSLIVKSL
jgi:hypothetical protein